MNKKYYYKAMDKDMQYKGFQFEVGEIYTADVNRLNICPWEAFYLSEKLEETLNHYSEATDRHFLVEVLGNVENRNNKIYSKKIRIVREVNSSEIEEHIQKNRLKSNMFLAMYTNNIRKIERKSFSRNWKIRLHIGKNKNTPIYILEYLSKDEDIDVRKAVAKNKNAPTYILDCLSKDKLWIIRYEIVGNPNISIKTLKELTKDKHKYVRVNAEKRLKEITQ